MNDSANIDNDVIDSNAKKPMAFHHCYDNDHCAVDVFFSSDMPAVRLCHTHAEDACVDTLNRVKLAACIAFYNAQLDMEEDQNRILLYKMTIAQDEKLQEIIDDKVRQRDAMEVAKEVNRSWWHVW